ncbi:hypothetical protein BC830DRAFT_1080222 [Chytriomyces sp. MP71]|nr:hypothetical protein BC830DRAFT_1080222 [Chytriomyces sp. MP71]
MPALTIPPNTIRKSLKSLSYPGSGNTVFNHRTSSRARATKSITDVTYRPSNAASTCVAEGFESDKNADSVDTGTDEYVQRVVEAIHAGLGVFLISVDEVMWDSRRGAWRRWGRFHCSGFLAPCVQLGPPLLIDATAAVLRVHFASQPPNATLPRLPPELLDKIPGHLDLQSVMRLGHAIRYYKPIASAIYSHVRSLRARGERLWPRPTLRIPATESAASLLKLVHRSGGSVRLRVRRVDDLSQLLHLVPLGLPVRVSVKDLRYGVDHIELLDLLITCNTNVGALRWSVTVTDDDQLDTVARLWTQLRRVQTLALFSKLPDVLYAALPSIHGLEVLSVESNVVFFPPECLLRVPRLRLVIFHIWYGQTTWPQWLSRLQSALQKFPGSGLRVRFRCARDSVTIKLLDVESTFMDGWKSVADVNGKEVTWMRE